MYIIFCFLYFHTDINLIRSLSCKDFKNVSKERELSI
jgi:hypothetical protein